MSGKKVILYYVANILYNCFVIIQFELFLAEWTLFLLLGVLVFSSEATLWFETSAKTRFSRLLFKIDSWIFFVEDSLCPRVSSTDSILTCLYDRSRSFSSSKCKHIILKTKISHPMTHFPLNNSYILLFRKYFYYQWFSYFFIFQGCIFCTKFFFSSAEKKYFIFPHKVFSPRRREKSFQYPLYNSF